MSLTSPQKAILKADILADPTLNAYPNTADGAFEIAAVYNAVANPSFFVWKDSTPIDEIIGNGFDWARVDNLTVGRARIWEYMKERGYLSLGKINERSGVNAAFSQAADSSMRLAIFGHCQKLATRGERLFAVGTGTTTTDTGIGPGTTVLTSPITYQDVQEARNLP